MKAPSPSLLPLAITLVLSVPFSLWADGPQTGTIEGSALDAQGGALPGVTVTLTGPQGTRTAITDADGNYRFAVLPPGAYEVHGALEGLGEATVTTQLQVGERRGIDLELRSETAEAITVTAEAPLISKFETTLTATLSAEVTEEVAFSSRSYGSAVHQLPGVTSRNTNNDSSFMATPGGLTYEVGSFIEGVDISQTRRGGEFRFNLPTTSTAAISVQVAGNGAEYGRSTSGIVNTVIKSGTKRLPRRCALHRPEPHLARRLRGRSGPPSPGRAAQLLGGLTRRPPLARPGVVLRLHR